MQIPQDSFTRLSVRIDQSDNLCLFSRRPVEATAHFFISIFGFIALLMIVFLVLRIWTRDAIILGTMLAGGLLFVSIASAWLGCKAADGRTFVFDDSKQLCRIQEAGFTYLPYSEIDAILSHDSWIWLSTKTKGLFVIQFGKRGRDFDA